MFGLNQLNFQKVRNHLPYQDITMSHLKYRFWTDSDQTVNGEKNFNSPKLDIVEFIFLINLILFGSHRRLE